MNPEILWKPDQGQLPLKVRVIQRVSERLALGLPTEEACALEDPPLNTEVWEDAMQDRRVEALCSRAGGGILHPETRVRQPVSQN